MIKYGCLEVAVWLLASPQGNGTWGSVALIFTLHILLMGGPEFLSWAGWARTSLGVVNKAKKYQKNGIQASESGWSSKWGSRSTGPDREVELAPERMDCASGQWTSQGDAKGEFRELPRSSQLQIYFASTQGLSHGVRWNCSFLLLNNFIECMKLKNAWIYFQHERLK